MVELLEQFFSGHVSDLKHSLAEFERRLAVDDRPTNDAAYAELAECLDDSLAQCTLLERRIGHDPVALKDAQVRYREAIWPWFQQSWFMERSLTKPRGYPGDYLLLSSIYDRQAKSTGLGGYLDRYLLDSTLALGVLSRMKAAREFLQDEVARRQGRASILNVACGSCREYLGGFLADSEQVRLTCVDNDTEALDHVRDHIAPHLPTAVETSFTRYNALRMTSAKGNVQRFGRNDIIYSVGLCDYIPDDYLVPMLRGWRESLAEGGVVYVAFKDTELYDKAFYQWQLDWYFYQRTYEDCRSLFEQAGYDMDEMEVTRCDMDVIVNFVGRTKSAAFVRTDEASYLPPASHLAGIGESLPSAVAEGS